MALINHPIICRWAATPPWMESYTANLISSNFSRNLAISARILHVRFLFQAIISWCFTKIIDNICIWVANGNLYYICSKVFWEAWRSGIFILHFYELRVFGCPVNQNADFLFSFLGDAFKCKKKISWDIQIYIQIDHFSIFILFFSLRITYKTWYLL